jgi:hypothetical protein
MSEDLKTFMIPSVFHSSCLRKVSDPALERITAHISYQHNFPRNVPFTRQLARNTAQLERPKMTST